MRNLKGLALLFIAGLLLVAPMAFGSGSDDVTAPEVGVDEYGPPANVGVAIPADFKQQYPWEIQHKVRPGEYLYMLAGYYYLDGRKWNWIYEQNYDRIGPNPNRIRPGTVLVIRVPRYWKKPMNYEIYYDTTRFHMEERQGTGTIRSGPGYNEGPEGYVEEVDESEAY